MVMLCLFPFQKQRFLQNGWESAWAVDMAVVYTLLPQEDVRRCVRVSCVCVYMCVSMYIY